MMNFGKFIYDVFGDGPKKGTGQPSRRTDGMKCPQAIVRTMSDNEDTGFSRFVWADEGDLDGIYRRVLIEGTLVCEEREDPRETGDQGNGHPPVRPRGP